MKNNSIKNQNLNLKISIDTFTKYKRELNSIIKEVDNEYSNVFKSLSPKKINLSYLLFSQYKNYIFPSISYNNIISYNNFSFGEKFIYICNKFKENKSFIFDEKIFILWYFYLFFTFFNDECIKKEKINQIRYLLFETNEVVCSLYKKKNILINQSFIILDFNLMILNYYANYSDNFSNLSWKAQKIKKFIFFTNYFDLLEKISIESIKSNDSNDFGLIIKYLKKIINNSVLKNELNILLIVKNNLIQNYINNLFQNINVETEKIFTSYERDLISFYFHFIKYKYKLSDFFSNCMEIAKKSFSHLYNFQYCKDLIIKDIYCNEFNSNLLHELHEKNHMQLLSTSYFLFAHRDSLISISNEKIEIDKSILFFSFQIGEEDKNSSNNCLPLILIKNKQKKEYEPFLKIYLEKKIENKNEEATYNLCFVSSKINKINIINQDNSEAIINNKYVYYVAVHLNEKKMKAYLYYEDFYYNKNNFILSKEYECKPIKKETNIKFCIGNDENNSFYNGKIGPIIMIRAPQNKEIIKKDVDTLIKNIILLKDNYRNFLIIKSDLSKSYNNLIYNYQYEIHDIKMDEQYKKEIKGEFDCLLYLKPDILKFLKNKIINIKEEDLKKRTNLPMVFCGKNSGFEIENLKVSIITYENSEKFFALDNGLSFICLQMEYYNQFAKYYLLKSKNNHNIFNEGELNAAIKSIKKSLKNDILLISKHYNSKYLYDSYKKIILTLYDCLLNLNKISPIINDVFSELYILKEMYMGFIFTNREKSNNNIIYQENSDNDKEINNSDNSKLNENISNDYQKIYINAINSYIGITEIILSSQFYNNSQIDNNILLITNLFNALLKSHMKFDTIKYNENIINIKMLHNIFYKLINFINLLEGFYTKKENNNIIIIIDTKKKEFINLLYNNFRLLINILTLTNINDDSQEYFHEIFKFVFRNNGYNYYIIYSYLDALYSYKKNKLELSFNQKEIRHLKKFLKDLKHNNNEIENKKTIEIISYSLIYDYMLSNPSEIVSFNDNFLIKYLKKAEIPIEYFSYIKFILEKHFLFKGLINSNIINNLNNQEKMEYIWNLFEFIIAMIKNINLNKLNYEDNEIIKYLYEVINILLDIGKEIEIELSNNSNLNDFTIIYLIKLLKFLYFVSRDKELNLLFKDKQYFFLIERALNYCLKSSLFHCNIYIDFNIKYNIINIENKKLISEVFYDIFLEIIEQIYNKYKNDKDNENILEDDIIRLKNIGFIFENKYLEKDLEISKILDNTYGTNSIFFTSDFLKLLFYEKKYLKKYENAFQIFKLYKVMEEKALELYDIEKNNKESNTFDYCFSSLYFYKFYQILKKLDLYLKDKDISEKKKLIKGFNSINSALFAIRFIIVNDLFLLSQVNKDFFFKKITNNDFSLREAFKIIQVNIFNQIEIMNKNKSNKNSEGKDHNKIAEDISQEFSKIQIIIGRKKSDNINIKFEKSKLKYSSTFNENKSNIFNKLKKDKKITKIDNIDKIEKNIPSINEENDENSSDQNSVKHSKTNNNLNNNNNNNPNAIDFENEEEAEDEELSLELKNEIYSRNSFDQIDKTYIINPKKELMKTTFSLFFEDSFFNNKTFENLKNYYLNVYDGLEQETKLLNYPSKLKNFTNGLGPSFFFKENNKFFISKIFPITHEYFYNYINEHNILNDSIILIKKDISPDIINIDNKEENNKLNCELVKLDKIYFGYMRYSKEGGFLIFKEDTFKIDQNNLKEELEQKIFSFSALDIVLTENIKLAEKEAKNILLDDDIFPDEKIKNNKTLIIFYSDIEEIIERRFLFLWQGVEIFLKNGKSYIFNMLTEENYKNLITQLKTIDNILFREKDFLIKTPIISESWRNERLSTFEYLLLLNKYGSRSLNDPNQYYVFPWIVTNFTDLIKINKKESKLYEYLLKEKKKILDSTDKNKEKEVVKKNKVKDKEIKELRIIYLNNFRNLKYPVSAQNETNKEHKISKFQDEEEKFPHHHGTHYSTSSYVYYYLMRSEPFTSLLVELQNYTQENPDRMMQDLKDTIKIINSGNDNRELIPELFCKIDFFININCVFFGTKKNNQLVDDLNRIWENGDKDLDKTLPIYVKFIIEHQKLLNSNTISLNIINWIDNVFGVSQLPPDKKREKSFNVFIRSSYEEESHLHERLEKYLKKYEDNNKKILKKIANKINLIISFGQTPQKIFSEKHEGRDINEKNLDLAEENPNNYGHQADYLGDDFVLNFMMNFTKKEDMINSIKLPGIYFEINSQIEKIFILTELSQLLIINTNFFSIIKSNIYNFKEFEQYQLPSILFFDKFKAKNNIDYYIFNIKYSFSSFPIDNNDSNNHIPKLYWNRYIKDLEKINEEKSNEKIDIVEFKFMSCRHLDNSFKIYITDKNKKLKTYSFICEDFVMSCKTINSNSFIIGLRNGKLIKAVIIEYKLNTTPNTTKSKKEQNKETKYKIVFENYIQGHKGSINVIEIDKKVGVILTGGDDNKLFIRKLYDFELLTSITLKPQFLITVVKISPMNFLYMICYNKKKNKFIIFGYTLSGIKFAKSPYGYYSNLDFTKEGNIICLINDNEIGIFQAHNLQKLIIDKRDEDHKKYEQVINCINKAKWIQLDDLYDPDNVLSKDRKIISYLSIDKNANPKYTFNTLKISNISYFQ